MFAAAAGPAGAPALGPAGPGAGPGVGRRPGRGPGRPGPAAGSAGPGRQPAAPAVPVPAVDGGRGNQHGMRYWRSQRIPELRDEVIDVVAGLTDTITSPLSYVAGFVMGGAASRVDPEATAVGERGHGFELQHPRRLAAARPRRRRPRRLGPPRLDRPAPHGGLLALPLRRGRRRRGRLRRATAAATALKDRWDPDNFFRMNANIPPSRRRASRQGRDAMSTVLVTGATGNVGSRVVQGCEATASQRGPSSRTRAGRRPSSARRSSWPSATSPTRPRSGPPSGGSTPSCCGNLPPQVAYETGVIDAAAGGRPAPGQAVRPRGRARVAGRLLGLARP